MTEDAIDLEMNPDGSIKVVRPVGFSVALTENGGVLRLRYAATEADLETGAETALQLHVTANQVREIGATLIQLSDEDDARGRRSSSSTRRFDSALKPVQISAGEKSPCG